MAGEYVKNLDQRVECLWQKVNKMGGSAVDVYTKAEADAKFETQTDAASTYQAKADMASYLEEKTGGYFIVNNVRVYVGATQPVDAPTGSIWIGG